MIGWRQDSAWYIVLRRTDTVDQFVVDSQLLSIPVAPRRNNVYLFDNFAPLHTDIVTECHGTRNHKMSDSLRRLPPKLAGKIYAEMAGRSFRNKSARGGSIRVWRPSKGRGSIFRLNSLRPARFLGSLVRARPGTRG
jgi:hypothetical protein